MAPDFKSYLATQIVGNKQTVTYRQVARALKVHVNAAKCMLYEFYENENKRKSGSIYATYLIAGAKQHTKPTNHDEDEAIPSSPPPFTSSMLEPSQQSETGHGRPLMPLQTITLAREEVLSVAKEMYTEISSLHVYSLTPGRLADLVTLTDTGRDLYLTHCLHDSPARNSSPYGVIHNVGVRRRKGKRPNIPSAAVSTVAAKKDDHKIEFESSKPVAATTPRDETRPSSRDSVSSTQTSKPSLKRDGSSLFKAFAKQSAKPKLERKNTDVSTNASASGADDTVMADADEEDESEDEALFLDTKTRKVATKRRTSDVKKEREDKQAKMRRLVESDEEEEKEAPTVEDAADIKGDPPASKQSEMGESVDWSESDGEKKKQADQETNQKRNRSRRKVLKKRTMKDEDGYLVTKEEEVFESYSEDDHEPVHPRNIPKTVFSSMKSQPSSQKSTTSTKGTAKKKDIMSFFGKK